MTAVKKNPASVGFGGAPRPAPYSPAWDQPPQFSPEKIKGLVAELEVPFDPALIEWRVTNTAEDKSRGQILPYADPRAYMDRLNELFTPAGWTRKYIVNTSPNFERSEDQKVVAKVFVICDLTIYGINSHAATGEEWTDNPNAGTSAEAQAFKRACACFGLGRYLYSIGGVWVDLDERGRPQELPRLHAWATPEGWRRGMRPAAAERAEVPLSTDGSPKKPRISPQKKELVRQVEAMAEPLGKAMYRGLLKTVARAWNPGDIRNTALLKNVLTAMQAAEHSLGRLEAARGKIGPDALELVLRSVKLNSIEQVDNLDILRQLVSAAEEAAQIEST